MKKIPPAQSTIVQLPAPAPFPSFTRKNVHARTLVRTTHVLSDLLDLFVREGSPSRLDLWGGELALRSDFKVWQFDPAFRLLRLERALVIVERRPCPLPSRWRLDAAKLQALAHGVVVRLAAELDRFAACDSRRPGHWSARRRVEQLVALGAAAELDRLRAALLRATGEGQKA